MCICRGRLCCIFPRVLLDELYSRLRKNAAQPWLIIESSINGLFLASFASRYYALHYGALPTASGDSGAEHLSIAQVRFF